VCDLRVWLVDGGHNLHEPSNMNTYISGDIAVLWGNWTGMLGWQIVSLIVF